MPVFEDINFQSLTDQCHGNHHGIVPMPVDAKPEPLIFYQAKHFI